MKQQPIKFRRGALGYSAVLVVLMRGPRTVRELATELGCKNTPHVRRAVVDMHAAGFVHIAGWKAATNLGGIRASVWAYGAGQDAQPAGANETAPAKRSPTKPEMLAFIAAVQCLLLGGATSGDVAEVSGRERKSTQDMLKHMRKMGAIHIDGWERSGYTLAPTYSMGPGADASRPKRTPKRAIEVRYYQKDRARKQQLTVLHALAANTPNFNQAQSA